MKKIFITALTIAAFALSVQSCGSKSGDDENAQVEISSGDTDPVDFENGPNRLTPEQLDSITNFPDDRTPGEAVGALKYLYNQTEAATGTKRMEAMRKFKDFYDIVMGNHGNNFRTSIEKFKQQSGMDLTKQYEEYANILVFGDDTSGGATGDEVVADTIKTIGDSTSVTVVEKESPTNTDL